MSGKHGTRLAAFAFAAGLLPALAGGCFEYEENISLAEDLSGTAWIDISWSKGWEAQLPQLPELVRFLSRAAIEGDLPEGVKLESHEHVERFDRVYERMRFSFTSIDQLRLIEVNRTDGLKIGALFEDVSLEVLDDGTRVISRTILPVSMQPRLSDDERAFLGGFSLQVSLYGGDCSFRITTPSLPLPSDEPSVTEPDLRVGRTSTWRVPVAHLLYGQVPVAMKVSFAPPAAAEPEPEPPSSTGYVVAAFFIVLVVAGGAFAATRVLLGPSARRDAGEPDAGESDGLP